MSNQPCTQALPVHCPPNPDQALPHAARGHSAGAPEGRPAGPLTGPTVVDVRLAVAPRVARRAVAAVASVRVLAGGAAAARALHTLVDVNLAGLPCGKRGGALGSALPPGPGPLLGCPGRQGSRARCPGSRAKKDTGAQGREGPFLLGVPWAGGSAARLLVSKDRELTTTCSRAGAPGTPPPTTSLRLKRGPCCLTLPARGAGAGEALVVLGLLALATISAGSGGTRGQQHLTRGS